MPKPTILAIPYSIIRDMRIPELNNYVAKTLGYKDMSDFNLNVCDYRASQHVFDVLSMNYRKAKDIGHAPDMLIRNVSPKYDRGLNGFSVSIKRVDANA